MTKNKNKRKKRTSSGKTWFWTLFIVVSVALMFGAAFYFDIFGGFQSTALPIDQQCYVVSSGTTTNSFLCQGTKCDTKIYDTCSVPNSQDPIVIGRTSSSVNSQGRRYWYAIYSEVSKSLQSYCYATVVTGTLTNPKLVDLPYGEKGIIAGGPFNPCRLGGECLFVPSADRYVEYIPSNSCGADLSPLTKYNCQNQEVCSGSISKYTCTKDIYLDDVKYRTINYSEIIAGQYSSDVIRLLTNQKISASGGSIDWAVIDDSVACSASQCNPQKTGYFACSTGTACPKKSSTLTPCASGEFCTQGGSGAKCEIPFAITSSFIDAEGQQVTGYGPGEPIKVELVISTAVSSATLEVRLQDKSRNSLSDVQTKPISSGSANKFTLTFPGQTETKEYDIRLLFKFGTDQVERLIPIRVSNSISVVVKGFSERTGTTLFTNEPVTLEIRVFDLNGNPTSADTQMVAKLNSLPVDMGARTQVDIGVYTYEVTLQDEGKLSGEGVATKFGYTAREPFDFTVIPASIRLDFTNIGNYKTGIAPGRTYTILFETKDPQGNLIDTTTQIDVCKPGQAVGQCSKVTPTGDNGKYSFQLTPDVEGGWTIKATASAPGFVPRETPAQLINVVKGAGTGFECVSDDQCTYPQVCKSNVCANPTEGPGTGFLTIFLISAGIVILIIVILAVVLKRRSKSQVSGNLTGPI